MNLTAFFHSTQAYLHQGGLVMWPLAAGAFLLWYALGYRFLTLRRGTWRSLESLIKQALQQPTRPTHGVIDTAVWKSVQIKRTFSQTSLRQKLDEEMEPFLREIERFGLLIQVIVVVAPLAGLLGTVTGMIETFDALGEMSLHSQSGGIAGGISQALLTTQMGLSVAIPGLIIGQLLRQKQISLSNEIERLKELLCAWPLSLPPLPYGSQPFHAAASSIHTQDLTQLPFQREEASTTKRKKNRRSSTSPAIDISPLIDMVFILLIFFMVSTTFVKDMQIALSRPAQNSASTASIKAIRVLLDAKGGISMEGNTVQAWMLQSRLRALRKEQADRPVLVITHRLVRTERLIEIVDQCRLAGVKDVGVSKAEEAG
ncbi:MotA/TolQ/ExbB proton channel family protein [Myxococcota bacterium]|nr:MotA/TolQ/ExbB proton channel family protein [Myxococcota bacterium]